MEEVTVNMLLQISPLLETVVYTVILTVNTITEMF